MPATRRMCSGRYFGRTIARRSACGLLMVETVYAPGDELPWHRHESPYLLVVLGGALFERAGRRDNECARGTLVLNSAGEPHRDRVGRAGARCLNVELGPRWLERGTRDNVAYRFAGAALDAVGRLEAEFHRAEGASALEVESAVLRLLDATRAHPARPVRHARPWLDQVVALLHEAAGAAPEIRALAAAVDVHPAHLCRTFAAQRGCTIGQYVRRLRADRALRGILHTDAPLASLALESGFTDQSHLTRAVREFYQTTPARLRRECGRRIPPHSTAF